MKRPGRSPIDNEPCKYLHTPDRDWDYSHIWRILDDAQGLKLLVQRQEAATPTTDAQAQRILGEMRRKIDALLD
jgi:hypothetical protein